MKKTHRKPFCWLLLALLLLPLGTGSASQIGTLTGEINISMDSVPSPDLAVTETDPREVLTSPELSLPPVQEDDAPSGIMPPIFEIDPANPEDTLPLPPTDDLPAPELSLGEYIIPELMPGEAFTLELPISLTYQGQVYLSNLEALPDASTDYDQTIAALLKEVCVRVYAPASYASLPLADTADISADLIADGINHGYAVLSGLRIREDAEPGTYSLPVTFHWQENDPDALPHTMVTSIRFAVRPSETALVPFAGVPWNGGVIVYSYGELRQAIKDGYEMIYLGYNEENQGVIRYTDGLGIAIARSITIDGHDPLTGQSIQLVDWNAQGTTNGLYAAASGLTITLRNMTATGYNYYGLMYGSGQTGIDLRFENVAFTGRQMAHNEGAGSTVTFTGCDIAIANVGSGTEQEVAETTAVTFYGRNTIRRTGPQDNSLFWLKGNGSRTLTITAGAQVDMQTTDYMIYAETSSATKLIVHGRLTLTTTGSRGSATFTDQYLGSVEVSSSGQLTIHHQNTVQPTLSVGSLSVSGGLTLTRTGSTLPLIAVTSGGSIRFDAPSRVQLDNSGGALIRTRAGTATMQWTTHALNRYSGGSLADIWNNAALTTFDIAWTATTTGGTINAVTGLEQGSKGAAIGARALGNGAINLMSDTKLVLGYATLSIDPVYSGDTAVQGTASVGASIQVAEFAYSAEAGLGALLQSRQTTSDGRFSTEGNPFADPIRHTSRIYAIAEAQSLTVHVYLDVQAGSPRFVEIPPQITFETVALSGQDQLIHRTDTDWRIVIYDPATMGLGFALYARVDAPLTSSSGDVLADGLVFIGEDGLGVLTGQDLLIAHGEPFSGEGTYTIQWDADHGLLAHLRPFAGVTQEEYAATISWTLVDGP